MGMRLCGSRTVPCEGLRHSPFLQGAVRRGRVSGASMSHTVAIRLKIPDTTAMTAMTALRRLGLDLSAVERAQIVRFDDSGPADALVTRIERDETLFNPNIHHVDLLSEGRPRAGEAWIESLQADPPHRRFVSWRLFTAGGVPASRAVVQAAVDRLLCNPAIERAVL